MTQRNRIEPRYGLALRARRRSKVARSPDPWRKGWRYGPGAGAKWPVARTLVARVGVTGQAQAQSGQRCRWILGPRCSALALLVLPSVTEVLGLK